MPLPAWVPGPEGHDVLPVGVHLCTAEDVVAACVAGRVDEQWRATLMRDLVAYVGRLRDIGLVLDAVLIDGSFMSGKVHPGDIDCSPVVNEARSNPIPEERDRLVSHWIHPKNRWKSEVVPGLGRGVRLDVYGFVQRTEPSARDTAIQAFWRRFWQTSRASQGDMDKGIAEVRFS